MGDTKDKVTAFRLPPDVQAELTARLTSLGIVGISSVAELARKIVTDWCDGKLVYLSKQDMLANPVLRRDADHSARPRPNQRVVRDG